MSENLDIFDVADHLPDPLPADPLPTLRAWLDEAKARRVQPNPDAMAVATVDPDGRPSVRIVLCRAMDPVAGTVTFFTNRNSRKGLALAANPRAACDLFWDPLGRQAIVEGPVVHASDAESDAYFNSRRPESRIAAWASEQSRPLGSRSELLRRIEETAARFGMKLDAPADVAVPRPPHWGGHHVVAERVELWCMSAVRAHDRAEWRRDVVPKKGGRILGAFEAGPWKATRLQP